MGPCSPRELHLMHEISELEAQLNNLRERYDAQTSRLAEVATERNNLETALSSALARAKADGEEMTTQIRALKDRLLTNEAVQQLLNENIAALQRERASTLVELGAARQALADERGTRWLRYISIAMFLVVVWAIADAFRR